MAKNTNPRKKFNFSIQIVGAPIDPFLVQSVEIPEREIEVVEHGETNHSIKTGGRVSFGMIVLEKILTTDLSALAHTYFESWMASVQNPVVGGGLNPGGPGASAAGIASGYKRSIIITEFPESGIAASASGAPTGAFINQWTCFGCWPSKRDPIDLNRNESDNTIEKIELCTDYITKV